MQQNITLTKNCWSTFRQKIRCLPALGTGVVLQLTPVTSTQKYAEFSPRTDCSTREYKLCEKKTHQLDYGLGSRQCCIPPSDLPKFRSIIFCWWIGGWNHRRWWIVRVKNNSDNFSITRKKWSTKRFRLIFSYELEGAFNIGCILCRVVSRVWRRTWQNNYKRSNSTSSITFD